MLYLALLLIVLFILTVLHLLMRFFGFRGVEYTLHFSAQEVDAGMTVTLTETICNRKPLPMPWVKAELTTDAALLFAQTCAKGSGAYSTVSAQTRFLSSFYFLRPYAKIERHWQVTCSRRGIFSVSHAILVISDLLGTFEQSRSFPEATATIMVLPIPLERMDVPALPALCMTGDAVLERRFFPDRFAVSGIRPYMQGDNLRDLCHIASARMDAPMVYVYQDTADPAVTLVLDLCTKDYDTESVSDLHAYEQAIRLCCTYLCDAETRRIPVQLYANAALDGMAAASVSACGAAHVHSLRQMLAALPEKITEPIPRTLRRVLASEPNTAVLCITAHLCAELLDLAAVHRRLTVLSIRPRSDVSALKNVISIPLV